LIARLRADARALPVLAAIVIIFGLTAARNATYAQAGTYAAIYAIAAIGLSLLLGNVKQISIGQAGFFGIGAYSVAYLTTALNWPFWPAALVGVIAATIVGFGVGFIALRFRGHYLAMATLSFGLIVVGLFHQSPLFGGASGISSIPYAQLGSLTLSGYAAYWFAWTVALLAALLTLNLLRGRSGRAFETIRNDELAADVIGVPTRRYTIFAFAYAGALAGLAGTIYAAFLGLIVPEAVGVPLSIDFLLMVVLGGQGGVSGALIGAALIGFLDISGHAYENWREVAYGVLVILVVIAAPAIRAQRNAANTCDTRTRDRCTDRRRAANGARHYQTLWRTDGGRRGDVHARARIADLADRPERRREDDALQCDLRRRQTHRRPCVDCRTRRHGLATAPDRGARRRPHVPKRAALR